MAEIYKTSEDSFLMTHILKEKIPSLLEHNSGLKFLELGAGSGLHLETAKSLGVREENIFSVDINFKAVEHCKLLGFQCVHSDLFEKIEGRFDLIIFNPPYLPEDKKEPESSKISTTGGKNGSEIINRFLKQATNHLADEGKIFLLTSSLTKGINWLNCKRKLVAEKNLFFEKLFIWEISKS